MFLDTKKGELMKKLIIFFTILLPFNNKLSAENRGSTVYAYVNGLVCDFCARALEKTIGKQEAVKSIKVDLKDKIITINFIENQILKDNIITQLINDAGYAVRKITNEKK